MSSPNEIAKMENLIGAMQSNDTGIKFKSQKLFLTTIPAAFSGDELISWLANHFFIDEVNEATHIANLLLLHGYVYPLTDCKSPIVKDDPLAFYRFQAPYYWISTNSIPNATDYAIYLVKRTIRERQKYELEDYEQVALNSLRKNLTKKWEFIRMQANDQLRLLREKRRSDQIVLEAQERAFWRLHQPPPSTICCFEILPRRHTPCNEEHKSCFSRRKMSSCKSSCPGAFEALNNAKGNCSKSFESVLAFSSNRTACDWFLINRSEMTTPWIMSQSEFEPSICGPIIGLPTSDTLLYSPLGSLLLSSSIQKSCTNNCDKSLDNMNNSSQLSQKLPTENQIRLWATGFDNLLWDPSGCQAFKFFLEKEFSVENIRFWLAVNAYQFGPVSRLQSACSNIFNEFLAQNSVSEINIDGKTLIHTVDEMMHPSRFTFDKAKNHIYKLMKNDSYVRFLRSDDYLCIMQTSLSLQKRRTTGKTTSISLSTQPAEIGRNVHNSSSSVFSRQNTVVSTLKVQH